MASELSSDFSNCFSGHKNGGTFRKNSVILNAMDLQKENSMQATLLQKYDRMVFRPGRMVLAVQGSLYKRFSFSTASDSFAKINTITT